MFSSQVLQTLSSFLVCARFSLTFASKYIPIFHLIKALLLIIDDHLLYLQCGGHNYGSHMKPSNNPRWHIIGRFFIIKQAPMNAIPPYEVWKNVKNQFIAKPGELY